MLREYELFHGAILRSILIEANRPLDLRVDDTSGRVNSFVINGKIAIYLKHSERRLSPWGFTFTMDHIEELVTLKNKYTQLFIGLICWRDGVVFISPEQFLILTEGSESNQHWIRAKRSKRHMYLITGSAGPLERKAKSGVADVVEALIERGD